MLKSVELFAGAGGLAMGIGLAGFESHAVVEWDRWACDTLKENQRRCFPLIQDWNIIEGDVRRLDTSVFGDDIDLVSGGPPCQPFSMGGKHRAHNDERDMFPATVDVIRSLRPRAFIIENVRGLSRPSFKNYFNYILYQLSYPEIRKRENEDWEGHLRRLEKHKSQGVHRRGLTYEVLPRVLNAANYGVPQRRERVFIVGFRTDLGVKWAFPDETHSHEALLRDQWLTGEYWDRHEIPKRQRPELSDVDRRKVDRIKPMNNLEMFPLRPWRTLRDAVHDLPDPSTPENDGFYRNHRYQPGARSYKGHTGSPMDLPAKALKAGDHGVPGGENMMRKDNGEVRYFTVRESARLQTFPDSFVFHGSWTETMRQLGNAVPTQLGQIVASSVAKQLVESEAQSIKKLVRNISR